MRIHVDFLNLFFITEKFNKLFNIFSRSKDVLMRVVAQNLLSKSCPCERRNFSRSRVLRAR